MLAVRKCLERNNKDTSKRKTSFFGGNSFTFWTVVVAMIISHVSPTFNGDRHFNEQNISFWLLRKVYFTAWLYLLKLFLQLLTV